MFLGGTWRFCLSGTTIRYSETSGPCSSGSKTIKVERNDKGSGPHSFSLSFFRSPAPLLLNLGISYVEGGGVGVMKGKLRVFVSVVVRIRYVGPRSFSSFVMSTPVRLSVRSRAGVRTNILQTLNLLHLVTTHRSRYLRKEGVNNTSR